MAKKESVLKWTQEDKKNLKKAISDFNKKVRKLEKTRKDTSYLPAELDYDRTIKDNLITTRSELNRVLESLGRFKGNQAFKKVTLPSGDSLTAWEYNEVKMQQKQASLKIKRRMAQIKRNQPDYFVRGGTGTEEYQHLQSTLEAIQNFGKVKPTRTISEEKRKERLQESIKRIENWGSLDFEMRRALIYQENYFQMLEATYSGLENYDKVVEKLKSISNPIDFYKKLKAIESGEKLKDISFMYTNQPFQANLNRLAIELGIKGVEDTEEIEEGE